MYSIFQVYALSIFFDSQFNAVDLSQYTLEYIYDNYSHVYLSLNYTYSINQIYVDLNVFRKKYRNSQTVLADFVNNASNGFFTPIASLPIEYINYIRYMDSQLAGYSLTASGENIKLSNTDVGSANYYKYCLTSVDGFILPNRIQNGSLVVENAFSQFQLNGYSKIGIVSFENISPISIYPIQSSNIISVTNKALNEQLYLQTDINPAYVTMLVLNGYLIGPTTDAFQCIGNGLFSLNLRRLGYYFKLLDSLNQQYYNYNYILSLLSSTLTSQYSNIPPNTISIPLISTVEFINAYLTLPNTFLVQVNNAANIVVKNRNILNSEITNQLVSDEQPTNLLIGSQGRIVDYLYSLKKGKFIITSPHMYSNNYVQLKSRPLPNDGYLSRQRDPFDPIIKSYIFWKQYGFY